jgi:hypothetical protein
MNGVDLVRGPSGGFPAGARLGAMEVLAPACEPVDWLVYHARDTRSGEQVTLKAARRADHRSALRLEREAVVAQRVQHENLPRFVALDASSGAPVIVYEAFRGQALRALFAPSRRMTRESVLDVFDQVLAALAALHAHGIVHGNLDASDVIVFRDDDGVRRVRVVGALGEPAPRLDSPHPPLAISWAIVGDIVAALLLLHEMLAGASGLARAVFLRFLAEAGWPHGPLAFASVASLRAALHAAAAALDLDDQA